MYLKSLTMKGFKSFADRTTMYFEPGITVIVGPNGSGKSNIADAVLWVLGEQSPRNLRGSRMEDVIFEGSAVRQPLGLAEVSLSFDNSSGTIPLDYEEVVVSRVLYRNGESEYLLNRIPTRLLDITELLSDFGVGRELTAVIGQNRLERVMTSRPEERRSFIEEAAGLLKHRRRKEKALRKLEGTEQNLVRIGDILSEVKKQLKPLERQAQVAEECRALERELRELQVKLVVAELRALQQQWENRVGEEERIRKELEECQAALREGKSSLHQKDQLIHRLRASYQKRQENCYRLSSCLERLRGQIRLAQERLKFHQAMDAGSGLGLGDLERVRREREDRLVELGRLLDSSQRELEELEREIESRERERWKAASDYSRATKRKNALTEEMRQLKQQWRYTLSQREEHSEREEGLHEQLREIQFLVEKARGEAGELGSQVRGMEKEIREEQKKLTALGRRKEELLAGLGELRRRMDEAGNRLRFSEEEKVLAMARLQALYELFERRVDYAAGASQILEAEGKPSGIKGMFLHFVKIDPEWERALESFLGPWLFALVAERMEDAVRARRMLREEQGGYALFFCLEEFTGRWREDRREASGLAGEVWALEAVQAEPFLQPVLEFLLKDVALFRSLEEAVEKAEIYPRLTFLTPEGEVISSHRIIKGGSRSRSPFHLLAKGREVEELQEKLERMEEENLRCEMEKKNLEKALEEAERSLLEIEEEVQRLLESLRKKESLQREALLREQERKDHLVNLERKLEELREERDSAGRKRAQLDAEGEGLREKMEDLTPALLQEEEKLREAKRLMNQEEAALKDLYYRRASLSERISHLEERMGEAKIALKELEENRRSRNFSSRSETGDLEELLMMAGELEEEVSSLHQRYSQSLQVEEEEIGKLDEEMERLGEELETQERRADELREAVHNWEILAVELRSRVEVLAQKLVEEFGLSLEDALRDFLTQEPVEDMRVRVEQLQARR